METVENGKYYDVYQGVVTGANIIIETLYSLSFENIANAVQNSAENNDDQNNNEK
ncbi:hypothetical protein MMKA1_08930 [Methanococcus maripaludis KA1]|uniref:Uncharacterized protein n=1 Tax=Methanococcus maripaludis KA1 TaxID=637914 RepID=A0A2Z5PEB9_METMI|nr:hypothetical protein [Methanococcus maripaludis]BAP61010.1 hypothetical protein MMKA1_08930 [Methanococcus maripaludis KA1]